MVCRGLIYQAHIFDSINKLEEIQRIHMLQEMNSLRKKSFSSGDLAIPRDFFVDVI
jgi:hypothetical protein